MILRIIKWYLEKYTKYTVIEKDLLEMISTQTSNKIEKSILQQIEDFQNQPSEIIKTKQGDINIMGVDVGDKDSVVFWKYNGLKLPEVSKFIIQNPDL